MPDTPATPAQVTYTTNPILSPTVLGGLVTFIATLASAFGVHVLDDPQLQQTLVVVLGLIGTAIAHYLWPHQDGRLSFSAPLVTPAPQNLSVGTSTVTVPRASATDQTVTVISPQGVKS